MRRLGIEPRSVAWKATVLPLNDRRVFTKNILGIFKRLQNCNNNLLAKIFYSNNETYLITYVFIRYRMTKQISLTMSDTLHTESKKRAEELGYRSLQEYLLELSRRELFMMNIEKYKAIEARMKKGVGVKKMTQKEALEYIKSW